MFQLLEHEMLSQIKNKNKIIKHYINLILCRLEVYV